MSKIMTVDILSNIKGAEPSKAVNRLFEVIKSTNTNNNTLHNNSNISAIGLNDLREDIVAVCSATEKKIILENFPKEKNGYLVVSKVIEY